MSGTIQKAGYAPHWLLILRLMVYVLLLGIVVFLLKSPDLLRIPFLLYSLFTLVFLLHILFIRRFPSFSFLDLIIAFQIILEIYVESGIIHLTGGEESHLSILLLITIVSVSFIYHLAGTVLVATLSSFAYAYTVLLAGGKFPPPLSYDAMRNLSFISEVTFYQVILYVFAFYLVAYVSGYLTQKLRRKGEELFSTSLELNRIRMETDDILQHMRSGLLTIDNSGRIIYFNKTAEDILGYKAETIKGERFMDVFRQRMPEFADKLQQALKTQQMDSRSEILITSLSGKRVPLGLSTSILGDDETGKRGLIAVFADITQAKRLEEEIRLKDRLAAVGELSAGIAHEIRNPLASISGSVEVLEEELSLSGENEKLMELILKETGRLNLILTEFLQYAKIGETPLRKVELISLVQEVIELVVNHKSYHPGIEIKKSLKKPPLYVWGEENQIKQLLLNLLVNALEAMEEKSGKITITNQSLNRIESHYFEGEVDEKNMEWVPLAIQDEGKGMNEEQKDKLFWPFYSSKKDGTGLGLAIVQRLVNTLEGRIEFRSKLGIGSVFVIYFKKFKVGKQKVVETVQDQIKKE
jgi:two-component system sensor histidine kinase PilS (NtrC family)